MPKYRNISYRPLYVRKAGVLAQPGEVFDSAVVIDNGNFELVTDTPNTPKKQPETPAKES